MRLHEDLTPLRRRASVLFLVILAVLGTLHARLAHLQLLRGPELRSMAENNRLRSLPVEAARGRLYDRRGQVLADNVPSFRLLLFPHEASRIEETLLFVAALGIASPATLRTAMAQPGPASSAPVVVGENLVWEQVAALAAHQRDHPELAVVSGFTRHYPMGALTAHAVGHLRLISEGELAASPGRDPHSLVGASAVEALKEETLAGRAGLRRLVVNAVGRQLGVISEERARPGEDLTLTLDARLQLAAAAALGDQMGAVVALDPSTGAVRCLLSAPSFDPGVFSGRLSREDWTALRSDPQHPLQNRCTQGVYPPGSTIKPMLALTALERGLISPDWRVFCRGSVVLYDHKFRCWKRGGHGHVDLERSLEVSCDSYYYRLGQRLGIDAIAEGLRRFGWGEVTGIGFRGEHGGLVGTPQWSRTRGQTWYPGTTVNVSIGQGPVLATPLQLARAYAALVNGGFLVTPFIAEDPSTPGPVALGLDPHHLRVVLDGLLRVVHGSEGTARALAPLAMAGKTGTAQVARLREGVAVEELEFHLRHHALFVGWAPLDEPTLVVAVVVEHGGSGSAVAAPVAQDVLRTVLEENSR